MVGLYNDPKGENIFKNSNMTDPSAAINATNRINESSELHTLRRRVKDLETELSIKEKVRPPFNEMEVRYKLNICPLSL